MKSAANKMNIETSPMTNPDDLLYPVIEPYQHGQLQVSPLHSIYYEQCGNPDGQPVVVLHGGPGSGCTPMQRRFFDPLHFRIILLDQRGCKRSLPLGCIEENTTQHLADDLELLREHLGIARWLIFGGSWGSTLALAYASRHHPSITGMILRGIFLCRKSELNWFLHEAHKFFPEAWEEMAALLPFVEHKDILHAYYKRVFSNNSAEALTAALRWNAYESAIMSLLPSGIISSPPDNAIAIGRARVQLHYLINYGFIAEQPLLDQVEHFRHIPAVIVQGRYDMVCPPISAYELHHAWPEARLDIVPDAGHSAAEPGIITALIAATESFKHC
jgi:proline iminopeptidase